MPAWNGWYHVTGGTYGTWLPGDPRGWRARGHKEHVDGDYKAPPPRGRYAAFHSASRGRMKHDAVILPPDARVIGGQAMVEMLLHLGAEVLAFSLGGMHLHVLIRFGRLLARRTVGRAKKHAYHVLQEAYGLGRIWAAGCRPEPIADRQHQVNVYQYVLDHAREGAWVWRHNRGVYWETTLRFDDAEG